MSLTMTTKQELKNLLKKTKHQLSIDDVDVILEMDAVAKELENADSKSDIRMLPLFLGSVCFWRPSIGGLNWYIEHSEWFADDPLRSDIMLAYILNLGKESEQLLSITDKRTCIKAINKFAKELTCTRTELSKVFSDLVSDESSGDEESKGSNYGYLLASLSSEYGKDMDYFIWSVPLDKLESYIEVFKEKKKAEIQRFMSANGGKFIDPDRVNIIKRLRAKRNEIAEKWNV